MSEPLTRRAARAFLAAEGGWHTLRDVWLRDWPDDLAPTQEEVSHALMRLVADGEAERRTIQGRYRYRLREQRRLSDAGR